MLRASIDIGSNSCLLLIGRFDEKGIFHESANLAHITSLGKNLDKTGVFCDESMNDTWKALDDYCGQITNKGIDVADTIVTATEAARVARNSNVFFQKVQQNFNLKTHIISSNAEAWFTFLGASLGLAHSNEQHARAVLMDIGGASTELILGSLNPTHFDDSISLPVGGVRALEWLEHGEFEERMAKIMNDYGDKLKKYSTNLLICTAGTMTSLANMMLGKKDYEDAIVNGSRFTIDEFFHFEKQIRAQDAGSILSKYPFLGKRSLTIASGACVARYLSTRLGAENLQISTYGLRYGTLYEGLIKEEYEFRKIK